MTDETKHTPGPWRVEEGTTLIWGDCSQDDQTNYGLGYPIAECRLTPSASWSKGPRTYDEAEANARLIASAPEMLEALKSARMFIMSVPEAVTVSGDAALYAIDQAIDKAEGRSK